MSLELLDPVELRDTMRELTVEELDHVSGGKCICGCGMDKILRRLKSPSASLQQRGDSARSAFDWRVFIACLRGGHHKALAGTRPRPGKVWAKPKGASREPQADSQNRKKVAFGASPPHVWPASQDRTGGAAKAP